MITFSPVNISKNWTVIYSPYVDDLSIHDGSIGAKEPNCLRSKKVAKGISVVFDKKTNEPLMFEIKNASERLGEIDDLKDHDIIKVAKEYLNGQTK